MMSIYFFSSILFVAGNGWMFWQVLCISLVSWPSCRLESLQTGLYIAVTSYECHAVSNHQQFECLLNILCIQTTTKTPKLRITDPVWKEPTGDRWISLTNAINVESVSRSWRHYAMMDASHSFTLLLFITVKSMVIARDRSFFIANALEILQYCTKPAIYCMSASWQNRRKSFI